MDMQGICTYAGDYAAYESGNSLKFSIKTELH
jgi:hypothetical protein